MNKPTSTRIYSRNGRFYVDLRDLGGGRKAIRPRGSSRATKDLAEAERIAQAMVDDLMGASQPTNNPSATSTPQPPIPSHHPQSQPASRTSPVCWDAYATRHLECMIKMDQRADSTVKRAEQSLRWFRKFLVERGLGDIPLVDIDTPLVTDFLVWRSDSPGSKPGKTLGQQTLLNDRYSLSRLLGRAVSEGILASNPVERLPKVRRKRKERTFLEILEGALLLQAAAWFDLHPSGRSFRFLEPLIATMLIQGLRPNEAFGLQIGDVSLSDDCLRVRELPHRGIKTNSSIRSVPLWPQFKEIIVPHIERRRQEGGSELLFPSPSGEGAISDIRGSFQTLLQATGIGKPVTPHTLRHTYAGGSPIFS